MAHRITLADFVAKSETSNAYAYEDMSDYQFMSDDFSFTPSELLSSDDLIYGTTSQYLLN